MDNKVPDGSRGNEDLAGKSSDEDESFMSIEELAVGPGHDSFELLDRDEQPDSDINQKKTDDDDGKTSELPREENAGERMKDEIKDPSNETPNIDDVSRNEFELLDESFQGDNNQREDSGRCEDNLNLQVGFNQ